LKATLFLNIVVLRKEKRKEKEEGKGE